MIVETLEDLPEQVTRAGILDVLRCELGDNEDTEQLIGWIQSMWETIDLLVQRFGQEDMHKIVHASVSPPPTIHA